jgi:hypothetical protein
LSKTLTAAEVKTLLSISLYDVLPFDACHFSPRTTNGAEAETEELATNDVIVTQFLCDPITEEGIQLKFRIPDDWDGGTLKAKIGWDGSTGASPGDVVMWGVRARATANDEAMDQAFGAEVTITDTLLAVGDFHETAATAAISIGGSPVAGGMAWLQVVRKAADVADTMDAEDAKFLCIALQYGKGTVIAAW